MRVTCRTLLAAFSMLIIPLVGCSSGSSSQSTTTSPASPTSPVSPPTSPATPATPTYPSITGNWAITALSQTGVAIQLGGYITDDTSGNVSGTLHVLNSACYGMAQDISITGTISTAGNLVAGSPAVTSQTINFTGAISNGLLSNGTYTITGGCANGDKGTVTGYIAPSYTATYTGTFVSSPQNIPTTVVTTESGPDADGFFHVTGTAAFSSSPCFTKGTITSSTIAGAYMLIAITTDNNGAVSFLGYNSDPKQNTIAGVYDVTVGLCDGNTGDGTITAQGP